MGEFGTVCWENRESTCHMSCQTGRKLVKITDLPFTIAMNTWIEGGAEKVNLTQGGTYPTKRGQESEFGKKTKGCSVKESKLGMVKVTILLRGGM